MDARTEAQYLDFVAQATPALFRVAYALTGRQQDAEDLLQTALERLVPRWRRVDDPVAYPHPTRTTWRTGDREVVCITFYSDGLRTGSIQGG